MWRQVSNQQAYSIVWYVEMVLKANIISFNVHDPKVFIMISQSSYHDRQSSPLQQYSYSNGYGSMRPGHIKHPLLPAKHKPYLPTPQCRCICALGSTCPGPRTGNTATLSRAVYFRKLRSIHIEWEGKLHLFSRRGRRPRHRCWMGSFCSLMN